MSELLDVLPDEVDLPVVLAQHRAPDAERDSLEALLRRHTRRTVVEAGDKDAIQPQHVYVAPPDYHLLVEEEGSFALSTDERVQYARPSVDVLFESAADAYGERTIGIVLTGRERGRRRRPARDPRRRRGRDRAGPGDGGGAADARRRDRGDRGRRDPARPRDGEVPPRAVRAVSEAPPTAAVLLVDDRAENLLALEAILEPLGQELVRAHSGEEALRELLRRDFAVILLDVQMPGIDGFETARLIKERKRTRHIPILFLTAISRDSDQVFRGYSAGAVDYILKPFDADVLRSKVGVFVELWQKGELLRRQEAELRQREVAEAVFESEARYRTLAEAMPQIVLLADRRRQRDVLQRALVRVHRARRRARLRPGVARDRAPGRPARDDRPVRAGGVRRRGVRDGVPAAAERRPLPLAPRPRRSRARRGRADHGLRRHRDGHRRPAPGARRAAAPRRGGGHPRLVARLPEDAAGGRPGRGPRHRRLGLRARRRRRRLARAGRGRARRPGEADVRRGAGGAVPAGGRRPDARGAPHTAPGVRRRDHGGAARRGRRGRPAPRPPPRARPALVDRGAAPRRRRGPGRDHVRPDGVRPRLRRRRSRARAGARAPRGHGDGERAAVRRGRAAGAGRQRARERRRRGRARRRGRRRPALEPGRGDDHGDLRGRGGRPAPRGRHSRAGGRSRSGSRSRAGPGRRSRRSRSRSSSTAARSGSPARASASPRAWSTPSATSPRSAASRR